MLARPSLRFCAIMFCVIALPCLYLVCFVPAQSTLFYGVRSGSYWITLWALMRGADPNGATPSYVTIVGTSGGGDRPLWMAVRQGNARVVKILLHRGADTTVYETWKVSPWFTTAVAQGHLEVVRLLQERNLGWKPTTRVRTPDYDLYGDALLNGHYDVAAYLIEIGVPLRVPAKTNQYDDYSALSSAVQRLDVRAIQFLMAHGVDTHARCVAMTGRLEPVTPFVYLIERRMSLEEQLAEARQRAEDFHQGKWKPRVAGPPTPDGWVRHYEKQVAEVEAVQKVLHDSGAYR